MEEASGGTLDVFPDNLTTVNVFITMGTQWRVGMNGPTGMDYAALPSVLELMGVERDGWADVFDGIRTMEEAALGVIHAAKK